MEWNRLFGLINIMNIIFEIRPAGTQCYNVNTEIEKNFFYLRTVPNC